MNGKQITTQQLTTFARHLRQAERSPGTVENYLRHVRAFAAWLAGRPVTKEAAADWKEYLLDKGYCPSTINAMLGGLNRFFDFVGWKKYQVKALRLQRQLFRDDSKELTRAEYDRLITAAHTLGRERLALLMETICATGIRVSELKFITAEAVATGRAEIVNKGKRRVVFLPSKLRRLLRDYLRAEKITAGTEAVCQAVFVTRTGKPLDRSNIWRDMKRLCKSAGVEPSKVFPHNLRHRATRSAA